MATTNSFSVRTYGEVKQQPPYQATADGNGDSFVSSTWTQEQSQVANFPAEGLNIWPINPGVKMNGGTFCYSVIEFPPSGLNQFGDKYVVQETVTALATLRNA